VFPVTKAIGTEHNQAKEKKGKKGKKKMSGKKMLGEELHFVSL
jgi:hypothetical protein